MLQRALFALVAIAALALACYNAVMPSREGTLFGALPIYENGQFHLVVRPHTPASRAGLRDGDIVDIGRLSTAERMALIEARAGETYAIPLQRAHRDVVIQVTAAPDQFNTSSIGRLLDLLIATIYIAFGSIVMARAKDTRSLIIAWLTVVFAFDVCVADYSIVAANSFQAGLVRNSIDLLLLYACATLIVVAITLLPIGTERLRRCLRMSAPVLAFFMLGSPFELTFISLAIPQLAIPSTVAHMIGALSSVYSLIAAAAIVVLIETAPIAERLRVRWFGWSIAIGWYVGVAMWSASEVFPDSPIAPALIFVSWYLINIALAGPVYASLRHHLIDLDIIISRSTVFGAISIALVSAFIIAEWLGGRVADTMIEQGPWRGIASQSISFGLALAIGMYGRRAHARLEERVNSILFRERTQKLAVLAGFAHEADVVDSRHALLRLTFEAFSDALKPAPVALYVKDDLGFSCAYATAAAVPKRLPKDNRLALQLLLKPEPFLSRVRDLDQWLIVPLVPRADVIGFLACGERPDRSAYVKDEIAVIERVGKHVATSYALLPVSYLSLESVGT